MIRLDCEKDWLLLGHADHAALAGEFARHWKNERFAPPEPFAHILDSVSRHDDSWRQRDAEPDLTPEGHPSAFSRELVGTYEAFEDIDLAAYLGVRGGATEQAAARDPYSAVLISMHTVNLLTEQADPDTLDAEGRNLLDVFVAGQRSRQAELLKDLAGRGMKPEYLTVEALRRGFEFLQACDSFSLLVGVDYPDRSALRHRHPFGDSNAVEIAYLPLGDRRYRLDPWPLDEPELVFDIPYRRVAKSAMTALEPFRAAYANAAVEPVRIVVTGESL